VSVEDIYEVLSLIKSNEYRTRILDFCSRLGKIKPIIANELFDYSLQKNDEKDFYILSNILIGLYEVEPELSFSKTKDLLGENPTLAYFTLGRLNYKNKTHILECFAIAEKVNVTDIKSLPQIPYIYKTLIENAHTSNEIKQKCFDKLGELFSIEDEELRNTIFWNLQIIEGYEKERYKILVSIILKLQNYFNRINDYFRNFSDSDYFFELFVYSNYIFYKRNEGRFDVRIFSESLSHFWRKDKDKTEQHLLDLISHDVPFLRISAVELIKSGYRDFYEINLLSLDAEIKQLRALEALFFHCFFNVDKFLPLLLSLKQSPHQNVVLYLQAKLSELIVESYRDCLYDKIVEMVKDEDFLINVM